MASPPADPLPTLEQDPPPLDEGAFSTPDKASLQLLAPPGWQKKIASLKKGGTPKKKDVYFIAPDGEELKSKRLLDRYLKSHPGGPASSEFDWSAGETPTRRSSRLSSKTKSSLDSPEDGSGGKRRKKDIEGAPLDEEKEPVDEPVSEVPSSAAKQEEAMLEVEKSEEMKTVEDTVELPLEENDDEVKEPEPVDEQTEPEAEATAEVVQGDMQVDEDKEPEGQVPIEEKLAGEQFEVTQVDAKVCEGEDAGKDELDTHDGKVTFLEEQKEQKEVSDKMSTGFQQFSDAQNSSRPVGVSI